MQVLILGNSALHLVCPGVEGGDAVGTAGGGVVEKRIDALAHHVIAGARGVEGLLQCLGGDIQ